MSDNSNDFVKVIQETLKPVNPETPYGGIEMEGFIIPFISVEGTKLMKTFNVRPDDILVSSYPKSGTTWLQQVVYLITHGSVSARTETKGMEERFPYLEYPVPGLDVINNLPSPRMIKTHLPLSLLPPDIIKKKPKLLYIARNPKDVLVSFHHFLQIFSIVNYNGKLEDMFEDFINDRGCYTPWTEHVKQYWEKREEENILFVTYEDMSNDLPSCVRKVADFLGNTLPEEEIQAISRECSFTAMKTNDTTNYIWWDKAGILKPGKAQFMRKGKVGDWKNHLTPEMSDRLDRLLAEKITPLGLNMICKIDEQKDKM